MIDWSWVIAYAVGALLGLWLGYEIGTAPEVGPDHPWADEQRPQHNLNADIIDLDDRRGEPQPPNSGRGA